MTRNRIARLNPDGTLDHSFLQGFSGTNDRVEQIVVQDDGKVLIVGEFDAGNGESGMSIARLNGDGTFDTSFSRVEFNFPVAYLSAAL